MAKNNKGVNSAPKISLSMIIKNEEKFLEGCLQSVQGIVDEIVIVDTGSTDSSKEIAMRFGAKLHDFAWIGDFAAARNFALQQCSGNWILYLDADERVAVSQGPLLRKLAGAERVGAYNVMIENPHSLRQGNFNQANSYPRLFRNVPGVQFEGKVHEQVWPSLMRQQLVVKQSPLVIQHLGYDQGYDVVKQKAERNLELLQNQLSEHPDDAYAQFQIGNSFVVLQRYHEAKPALELALANKKLHGSNRASCYNLLAEVEVKSGNLGGAVDFCLKSLQLAPRQLMANWFLSLLYFDLREYDKAIGALIRVDQLLRRPSAQRSDQVASDLDLTKDEVRKRFALTYEAAGQYNKAMEQYAGCLKLAPDSDDALTGVLRCVDKCDDSRVAIETLMPLTKQNPGRKDFFFPLAYHHRRLNDYSSAIGFIDRTIQSDPVNTDAHVCAIRWRMESGDLNGAERILALAESKELRSFDLHKCGMQLSLQKGNVNSAFHHLELMTQTTDVDLTPLKNRISAIAAQLSASSVS